MKKLFFLAMFFCFFSWQLKSEITPSLLFDAIKEGNLEKVKLLLDMGLDVDQVDLEGNTPLMLAVAFSHKEMVELLLKYDPQINLKCYFGLTPLMLACMQNDIPLVKFLIEKGAFCNLRDWSGETALFKAVRSCDRKVVAYLLDKGANFRLKNKKGETPLFLACKLGKFKVAEELLEKETPEDMKAENVFQIIHFVIEKGDVENFWIFYEKLKSLLDKNSLLLVATSYGKIKVVEFLLQEGADKNYQDSKNGDTALHKAVKSKNYKLIEYLLKQGVDVNIKNKEGKTPLELISSQDKLRELFFKYAK